MLRNVHSLDPWLSNANFILSAVSAQFKTNLNSNLLTFFQTVTKKKNTHNPTQMQQISDFMCGGDSSLTASPLVQSHLDTRILANATVSAEREFTLAAS